MNIKPVSEFYSSLKWQNWTLFNNAMYSWRVLPFDIFIHGEQAFIYNALRDIRKKRENNIGRKKYSTVIIEKLMTIKC